MKLNQFYKNRIKQLNNPFISETQGRETEKKLMDYINNQQCQIANIGDFNQSERYEIMYRISHSKLFNDDEKLIKKYSSSASCPNYCKNEMYWNIGFFGSVWSDIELENGRKLRVGFYDETKTDIGVPAFNVEFHE